MSERFQETFESIEGAQEYLALLIAAVQEAIQDVEADVRAHARPEFQRRLQAQRLVLYKLQQLEKHVKTSHRILNDLRSLRRLLFNERTGNGHRLEAEAQKVDVPESDGSC